MSDVLLDWLAGATFKGSLLLALALVIAYTARNRVPARWLCALLLLAAVRLLLPIAPASPFSAFNLLRTPQPGSPVLLMHEQTRTTPIRVRPLPVAEQVRHESSWKLPLIALWLAGLTFVGGRAIVRTFAFRRRVALAKPVTDPEVLRLVDEGRDALRVHRSVRVLESSAVSTPSLHGWLQPALLVPEDFLASFSAQQVRYVVLHELAHVRRHDVLVNWILTLAHAVHWFNPLVALAAARLAEERELACDALALSALRDGEQIAYGGTVLALVDRLRPFSRVPAVVGMSTDKRQLQRRIQMIATYRKSRHSLLFGAALLTLGLVTLTDATAGERRMLPRVQAEAITPAMQATLDRLETKVSVQFNETSVENIVLALSNASGVSVQFQDGALTDAVRATRIDIKAEKVPAHLVLIETLSAVGLAARFTEQGVVVETLPEGAEAVEVDIPASSDTKSMVTRDRVIVVNEERTATDARPRERMKAPPTAGGQHTIQIKTDDGEEGTLELKVVRKP